MAVADLSKYYFCGSICSVNMTTATQADESSYIHGFDHVDPPKSMLDTIGLSNKNMTKL